MPVAEQLASAIMQGQAETAQLVPIVAHVTDHYNRALEQGAKKEQLKPIADFVKNAGQTIAKLRALDEEAASLSQESQAHDLEEQQNPIPDIV